MEILFICNVNDGIIDGSDIIVTVTEPINGCQSNDTVLIYYDLAPPLVTQTDIISTPPIFECGTDSLYLSVALPNVNVAWDLNPSVVNPAMSSFTIYSSDDSTNVYAVYNINN